MQTQARRQGYCGNKVFILRGGKGTAGLGKLGLVAGNLGLGLKLATGNLGLGLETWNQELRQGEQVRSGILRGKAEQ